jgi:signal transduction protein with GAF and PtsI domain
MCVREIVVKNRQLLREVFELTAEKDDHELEVTRLRKEIGSLRTAIRALLLSRDASWTGGHDWQVAVDQAAEAIGQAASR